MSFATDKIYLPVKQMNDHNEKTTGINKLIYKKNGNKIIVLILQSK